MMHEPLLGLPADSATRRIKKERIKVSVYTDSRLYSGYAHGLRWQRLTDILNGVLIGELRVHEEFLPLTETTMHFVNEREKVTAFTSINKAHVLFVRESEDGQDKRVGAKVEYRLQPPVPKLPLTIRVYVPSYRLTGEVHCAMGQRVSDVLNTEDRFLPLTNVEILSSRGTSESRIGFVSVNKEQIIYAEEV